MRRRVLLAAASAALGWFSLRIAQGESGFTFAGDGVRGALGLLGPALALLVAGLLIGGSPAGRGTSFLLIAASVGWSVREWVNPGSAPSWAFSVGLLLFAVGPALIAHAVLTFPSGLPKVWGITLVLTGYAVTVGLAGLAPTLWFDPNAIGCYDCARNFWLLSSDPERQLALARWGYGVSGIWALLTSGALLWLFARSSPPRRRVAGGLEIVASVYLLVVAATFGNWTRVGFAGYSSTDRALWYLTALLQVALAVAASSDLLRRRRLRRRLAGLVVDLDHTAAGGDINQALGAILGGTGTAVAFPLGPDSYIDSEGRALPVDFIAGSRSTPVVRDGRELALVLHGSELADLDLVAQTLHLSLENASLRARAAHQVRELQNTRIRLLRNGDAERRRLEQDLHDGAQQRLLSLLYSVQLLGPADDRSVQDAVRHLRAAIDQVRDLAHGLYPVLLEEEGLPAALEALAETAALTLRHVDDHRLAAVVETTLYGLVARALDHGPTTLLQRSTTTVTELELNIQSDHVSLGELEDRVAALGGSIRYSSGAGMHLSVRLPLDSAED